MKKTLFVCSLVAIIGAIWFKHTSAPTPLLLRTPSTVGPPEAEAGPALPITHESSPSSTPAQTVGLATAPSLLERIKAVTIATHQDQSEKQGDTLRRTRILETSLAYRWLRLEEQTRSDPTSGKDITLPPTLSIANQFIIQLASDASPAEVATIARTIDANIYPLHHGHSLYRAVFSTHSDFLQLSKRAALLEEQTDFVNWIEPDYLVHSSSLSPNDPKFPYQQSLSKGLTQTGINRDIDAPEAWETAQDSPGIVLAIIDSGIRTTHEDLAGNLWNNTLESPNGIDDDGNGYIDDLHGINAIQDNGNVEDDNGHGTHVAGIAGAIGNNETGIAGVSWKIQLMPLKFLGEDGFGATSDAIKCIAYAQQHGANVINNSWGGGGRSSALLNTLTQASSAGILIATAAGNEGEDLEEVPQYPASFTIPNQVVVISSDSNDNIARYSNRSPRRTHIAAPGRALSTYNRADDDYKEFEGTSFATPLVAGSLALLKDTFPQASPAQLIARLLDSVEIRPDFERTCISGGRLNLRRALAGERNAPENDDFTNAEALSVEGGSFRGTTGRATRETNEPSNTPAEESHTVWYSWQTSYSGNASITASPVGFKTHVALFTGSSLAQLKKIDAATSEQVGDIAKIEFQIEAGKRYYIQIESTGLDQGPFNLTVAAAAPNDSFENAVLLSGSSFNHAGNNRAASLQRNEAPLHFSAAGASMWHEWTATDHGQFHISVPQSSGQIFARIFTGESLSNLSSITSQFEPGSQSNQLFEAIVGQRYFIALDSLSATGASYTLHGEYLEEPKLLAQPSDQIADIGDTTSFTVSVLGLGLAQIQWFKDDAPIPQASQSTLTIQSVEESDLGAYHVQVQISGYTLVSRTATLAKTSPSITFLRHPLAQSLLNQETIELSALVSQSNTSTEYQWLRDGVPIPGATAPKLSIQNATPEHNGFYQLQVRRGNAVNKSNTAYILVSKNQEYLEFAYANNQPIRMKDLGIKTVGEYFVSTGASRLQFSYDGLTLQQSSLAAADVIEANGSYLAFNRDGLFRSQDLMIWEPLPTPQVSIGAIAYGNGTYLIRSRDAIYASRDAQTWTLERELPYVEYDLNAIEYGNGLFIAKDQDALRLSNDGRAWTSTPLPTLFPKILKYGDGAWWLLGGSPTATLYHSLDGINWRPLDLAVDKVRRLFSDPVDDKIYFIGETEDSASRPGQKRSMTTVYRMDGLNPVELKDIHYDSNPKAPEATAKAGRVLLALFGKSVFLDDYLPSDLNPPRERWWERPVLSFANGLFIADSEYQLRSSPDGVHWQVEATDPSRSSDPIFGTFAFGNGIYVGKNHYGSQLSSLKRHNQNFQSIAFGNNVFLGATYEGISYSSDGETWAKAQSNDSGTQITFGDGVFLSWLYGNLYRSLDGQEWSTVTLPSDSSIQSIVHSNDRFLLFQSDKCLVSTDGINWQDGGYIQIQFPNKALYFKGKFIVPYNDYLFESDDGTNWKGLELNESTSSYTQRYFYVAGNDLILRFNAHGIGILGRPAAQSMFTSLSNLSRQISIQAGSEQTITFEAQSLEADLQPTQIFVNGTHWKTLPANERSFPLSLNDPGTHLVEIKTGDKNGNTAQEAITVSTNPLLAQVLAPEALAFNDLIYFRGAYYAASKAGIIFISTDGVSWKGIQTPTLQPITHLAHTDVGIVARHEGEGILFSANGIDWTNIGTFMSDKVHLDGTLFVAGRSSDPMVSRNGTDWYSPFTQKTLNGAASPLNQERFVFNNSESRSYLHTPGKSATALNGISNIIQIDSTFLCTIANRLHSSQDLENWTEVSTIDDSSSSIQKVDNLVMPTRFSMIEWVSGDGEKWVKLADPIAAVTQSPSGEFYAIKGNNYGGAIRSIVRSKDAVTWEHYCPLVDSNGAPLPSLKMVPSEFGVALLSPGFAYAFVVEDQILTNRKVADFGSAPSPVLLGDDKKTILSGELVFQQSEDGLWRKREPLTATTKAYFNEAYYGLQNNEFVQSTDLENWSSKELPGWADEVHQYAHVSRIFSESNSAIWIEIPHRNGSYNQTYGRSTDGETWQKIEFNNGSTRIGTVVEFKGRSFSRDDSYYSRLRRSNPERTEWELIPIESNTRIDIAKTQDHLIFLSGQPDDFRRIYHSEDGDTFTEYSIPEPGDVDLVATDDAFYITGQSVWKSTDGINWSKFLPFALGASSSNSSRILYTKGLGLLEPTDTDLSLTNATGPTGEYAIDDELDIELTLKNNASSTLSWSPDSSVAYTLHSKPNRWAFQADDRSFTGLVSIPFTTLEAGESKTFNIRPTIPTGTAPGQYYLSANINSSPVAKDANPSNDFFFKKDSAAIIIPERTLEVLPSQLGYVEGHTQSEYALGERVLLIAHPNFGYDFSGWSGTIVNADETLLVTMDQNIQLTPSFTPRRYSVEFSVEGQGSINGSSGDALYEHGTNLTIDATPEQDWVFSGWRDIQSSSPQRSIQVGRNLAIRARFVPLYAGWAKNKYGDDPTKTAPLADPNNTGRTNLEHFALGLDYSDQWQNASLGFRREDDALVLRYAIYRHMTGIQVAPMWSNDGQSWYTDSLTTVEIDQTEDLIVFEARLLLEENTKTGLIALRLKIESAQ